MRPSRPPNPSDRHFHETGASITPAETEELIAELLARIGVALQAKRVELFTVVDADNEALLAAWWAALGHATAAGEPPTTAIPLEWFPWSLGNIKPAEYFFVRNAGPLPVHVDTDMTIGDLGMGLALYIPVLGQSALDGAAAVYWCEERTSWPLELRDRVREWAATALDTFAGPRHRGR